VITANPQSVTVGEGQPASFSVSAVGSPVLSYRWTFNGGAVGTNGPVYVRQSCLLADTAGQIICQVTNGFGVASSSLAILTVTNNSTPVPIITSQPQNLTVMVGQDAAFSLTATGSPILGYPWSFNGVAVGTNGPVYVRANCQLADSGGLVIGYVTNGFGIATSSVAILTVTEAPIITSQPQSVTVGSGQTALFTVSAIGSPTLGYSWTVNGSHVGTNGPVFAFVNAHLADNGGQVVCTVTNTFGSATSSAATLGVTQGPIITSNPQNLTVGVGNDALFTLTATGSPTLGYRWTFNGTSVGTNGPAYARLNCQIADNGGQVIGTVSNAFGIASSTFATLTVTNSATPPPPIGPVINVQISGGITVFGNLEFK
jgi:predicted secreted protein